MSLTKDEILGKGQEIMLNQFDVLSKDVNWDDIEINEKALDEFGIDFGGNIFYKKMFTVYYDAYIRKDSEKSFSQRYEYYKKFFEGIKDVIEKEINIDVEIKISSTQSNDVYEVLLIAYSKLIPMSVIVGTHTFILNQPIFHENNRLHIFQMLHRMHKKIIENCRDAKMLQFHPKDFLTRAYETEIEAHIEVFKEELLERYCIDCENLTDKKISRAAEIMAEDNELNEVMNNAIARALKFVTEQ